MMVIHFPSSIIVICLIVMVAIWFYIVLEDFLIILFSSLIKPSKLSLSSLLFSSEFSSLKILFLILIFLVLLIIIHREEFSLIVSHSFAKISKRRNTHLHKDVGEESQEISSPSLEKKRKPKYIVEEEIDTPQKNIPATKPLKSTTKTTFQKKKPKEPTHSHQKSPILLTLFLALKRRMNLRNMNQFPLITLKKRN